MKKKKERKLSPLAFNLNKKITMKKKKRLKQRLKRELALSKKSEQYHGGWVLNASAEGRNKFVNYVCSRRYGASSFEFLRYRDPFRNQLRRKEQPMRKVWPVILANRRLPFPGRGCATSTAENGFLVSVSQSSGVFARIDTPGDQIRPGENLKGGFTDPVCETTPACRFVISCLITVHRTVVSPLPSPSET